MAIISKSLGHVSGLPERLDAQTIDSCLGGRLDRFREVSGCRMASCDIFLQPFVPNSAWVVPW